ncbi:MAG: MBOAT family protein [Pseudomonadota bacterium]
MLFNSLSFLLVFAPLAFGLFFLLGLRSNNLALLWLALASIAFYAWWIPAHTVILLISISLNYLAGRLILKAGPIGSPARKRVLAGAVALNLLALAYYKYAGFFVTTLNDAVNGSWQVPDIILPLGISFFTFTQLAYLVDTYQGKVSESKFSRYLLFVTYFPHLIAGPIIHHKDVMPQFDKPNTARWCTVNVAAGLSIFMIGLFKKVVIADGLAPYVGPVFDGAATGVPPSMLVAWGGALAYTFQLYFDFSGYSDMAIGLSLALNVRLPFNFNSPYKAQSIIDFWKRWHISLSTFLRDYLYIPLGGNRLGGFRRYSNLLITMLIGGMWHGAGWSFIVWGGLHGSYLMINHAWRHFRNGLAAPAGPLERFLGWSLTFLAVVLAWVFFRATNFSDALAVLQGMAGLNGLGTTMLVSPGGSARDYLPVLGVSALLLWIVATRPNSQEIVSRHLVEESHFKLIDHPSDARAWRNPHIGAALALGVLTAVALIHISRPTQFLYFNF